MGFSTTMRLELTRSVAFRLDRRSNVVTTKNERNRSTLAKVDIREETFYFARYSLYWLLSQIFLAR